MHRTYKPLFWWATRPVNTADCMNEWKYFLKHNINISIIIRFKQYPPSIIQSVEFTGCVACQNNGLYVLCMIVKLAYSHIWNWKLHNFGWISSCLPKSTIFICWRSQVFQFLPQSQWLHFFKNTIFFIRLSIWDISGMLFFFHLPPPRLVRATGI